MNPPQRGYFRNLIDFVAALLVPHMDPILPKF